MTSSGRRVKRRNLDEVDGNTFSSSRSRKGKSGQKTSRRKTSKSKSSRPQRAAARNALHLFSKITGTPTDGEEDSLVGDSSDSESTLQESNIDSDESGRALQNDQPKYSKGKEVSTYESEDMKSHELTETDTNAVNRRRLVLKLPIRDSSKPTHEFDNQTELVASSSKTGHEARDFNRNRSSSKDAGYYSGSRSYHTIEGAHQVNLSHAADHVDLLEKIKWGVVRARSSKSLRMGEAVPSNVDPDSVKCLNHLAETEKVKEEKEFGTSTPPSEIQNDEDKVDSLADISENCDGTTSRPFNPSENGEELTAPSNCSNKDEPLVSACMIPQDTIPALDSHSGAEQLPEPSTGFPSVSTKLRSKRGSRDPECSSKQGTKSPVLKNSAYSTNANNNLNSEQCMVVAEDDNNTRVISNQGENGSQEIDAQVTQNSTSNDSLQQHSRRDKMFKAVYKRSKSHRALTNLADGRGLGESTSNGNNNNSKEALGFSNGTNKAVHTNGSIELEPTTCGPNDEGNYVEVQQGHEDCMVRSQHNQSTNRGQFREEEKGSSSKLTVGLRSARSRRSSYNIHEIRENSPVNRRKSLQSANKGSWLLLSTHEEGCRYIPQQGDEFVYLRQVGDLLHLIVYFCICVAFLLLLVLILNLGFTYYRFYRCSITLITFDSILLHVPYNNVFITYENICFSGAPGVHRSLWPQKRIRALDIA